MLSQARRFVIFAALASLLTLSFAPSAPAQEPGCVDQTGTDCDGDGVLYDYDGCREYGPAYGDPATATGCEDRNAPDGDSDYDGVLNKNDSCPSEGKGTTGVDAAGCPHRDGDGDGFLDHEDACPTEAGEGRYAEYPADPRFPERGATGCRGDTGWDFPTAVMEPADVTKRGWTAHYTVNPQGVPAVRVAADWVAHPFTDSRRRPPSDAPLASGVCKSEDWILGENENGTNIEASGRFSCKGSFDQGGCVHDVIWVRVSVTEDHKDDGTRPRFITRGVYGEGFPLTYARIDRPGGPTSNPSCKEAVKKAVAKCKKKPTETKKQRRKVKKCLKNARD